MNKIKALSKFLKSAGLKKEYQEMLSLLKDASSNITDSEENEIIKAIDNTFSINTSLIRDSRGIDNTVVGSPFGATEGRESAHGGQDYKIRRRDDYGTEDFFVYPIEDGRVTQANKGDRSGNMVVVDHGQFSYSYEGKVKTANLISKYMHLKDKDHEMMIPAESEHEDNENSIVQEIDINKYISQKFSSSDIYLRLNPDMEASGKDILDALEIGYGQDGNNNFKVYIYEGNFKVLMQNVYSINSSNEYFDKVTDLILEDNAATTNKISNQFHDFALIKIHKRGGFDADEKIVLKVKSSAEALQPYQSYKSGETFGFPVGSVNPSSPIGIVGNTGRSKGPHLHLEIHVINIKDSDDKVLHKDVNLDPAKIIK